MRICNLKLAERIANNESALVKLITERQFDPTANQDDVQVGINRCQADIERDTKTLLDNGFDIEGRKVRRGVR